MDRSGEKSWCCPNRNQRLDALGHAPLACEQLLHKAAFLGAEMRDESKAEGDIVFDRF
jgi:hypothetical protein